MIKNTMLFEKIFTDHVKQSNPSEVPIHKLRY